MRIIIASSILGIAWNVLAFFLASSSRNGPLSDFFQPAWLAVGLAAGLAAGAFTAWTRNEIKKSPVRELFSTLVTYYLAVCAWWATLGVGIALATRLTAGGGFYDLAGHLEFGQVVLLLATLYSPVLVPLCWLSRSVVRRQVESQVRPV